MLRDTAIFSVALTSTPQPPLTRSVRAATILPIGADDRTGPPFRQTHRGLQMWAGRSDVVVRPTHCMRGAQETGEPAVVVGEFGEFQ